MPLRIMNVKRVITIGNKGYYVEVPDECPICHRLSETAVVQADTIDSGTGVQVVCRCGFAGCRQFFLTYYGPPQDAQLKAVKPMKPVMSGFSEAVRAISPVFVQTFQEAEEAAQIGLLQISGPGYRKAFEFLIKDYAKSLSPEKANEIEAMFSGAVVNQFIPDARIQAVAKRTLWLGNDETHYLKKWTNHDLTDLVALIKLAAHWIDIEQLSKSYVQGMPE